MSEHDQKDEAKGGGKGGAGRRVPGAVRRVLQGGDEAGREGDILSTVKWEYNRFDIHVPGHPRLAATTYFFATPSLKPVLSLAFGIL